MDIIDIEDIEKISEILSELEAIYQIDNKKGLAIYNKKMENYKFKSKLIEGIYKVGLLTPEIIFSKKNRLKVLENLSVNIVDDEVEFGVKLEDPIPIKNNFVLYDTKNNDIVYRGRQSNCMDKYLIYTEKININTVKVIKVEKDGKDNEIYTNVIFG